MIVPIVVTIWLTEGIVVYIDRIFPLETLFGVYVPGLGLVLAFVIILLAGVIGRNIFGAWFVDILSRSVNKIPFIGSVYGSLRQVMMTLADTRGDRFGKAVLIQYPQPGSWTIGFVTAKEPPKEMHKLFATPVSCVFVPTTPNPTSGFFLFVSQEQIRPIDLSVDDAFKVVVSLGLVGPHGPNQHSLPGV